MSSVTNFLFGAVLVVVLIISSVLTIKGERKIRPDRDKDQYLNHAYVRSLWSAIIVWGVIGLFIILVILSILGVIALFGSGEGEAAEAAEALESYGTPAIKKKTGGSTETALFLGGAFVMCLLSGGLAASAAVETRKSPLFKTKATTSQEKTLLAAYNYYVGGAVVALVAVGLLVIGFVTYLVILNKRKQHQRQEAIQLQVIKANSVANKLRAQA